MDQALEGQRPENAGTINDSGVRHRSVCLHQASRQKAAEVTASKKYKPTLGS
jgi:hypothetical protein